MAYEQKPEAPVSTSRWSIEDEIIADFYSLLRLKLEHLKNMVREEQNAIEARNKAIADLGRVIDFLKNKQ